MEIKSMNQIMGGKWIIGMVHVEALPGTPMHSQTISSIIKLAVEDALKLQDAGVDAILIENMHDVPYMKNSVGPEVVACMTAISSELRKKIKLPLGIQILAAANKEAIAVALATELDFIRAEGFVFAHTADEGYIESCAGELLRYRKQMGAERVKIFTDVQKKHASHAITSDISLKEHIETAVFFLSDGIIVTGTSTGKEPSVDDVQIAHSATNLPVIIGSGITVENLENYWDMADAFIVGSHFKYHGDWKNKVSDERVVAFMKKVKELKELKEFEPWL